MVKHADGRVSFDITEEEQDSITKYFNQFSEPGKGLYVAPGVQDKLTSVALYNFAR